MNLKTKTIGKMRQLTITKNGASISFCKGPRKENRPFPALRILSSAACVCLVTFDACRPINQSIKNLFKIKA